MTGIRHALGIPATEECSGDVCVKYVVGNKAQEVIDAVQDADVAIVAIATTSSEFSDRPTLAFDSAQDALVNLTVLHQKKTVVVCTAPGAILTPWRNDVMAILLNFLPGQEYGNALADGGLGWGTERGQGVHQASYGLGVAWAPLS